MSESNLKKNTLSGMAWSAVQRFGAMIISFVSNIILARLLSPNDYGIIGMLLIFIAVANTFVDSGFGSALIQKKEPTKADYSTIFWWNIFLSIFIYIILFILAPYISRFYNIPILSAVLRVQGVVLIINALGIIQHNQMRKNLNFRKLAIITVVAAILSSMIAIMLALVGWNVWALVFQQILLSLFTTILLWYFNKWAPVFEFSISSLKELFSFGGYILTSNLINTICNNLQGLLMGKFFTPSILGYYTQARKLEEITATSFSNVVNQVSYPVFSKLQSNNETLLNILKKISQTILFITTPLMLILILIAHPLIVFLYSEKWLISVDYFQILCIGGVAVCLQNVFYNVVASVGQSRDLFIWTFYKRGMGLIVLFSGMILGGAYGLTWGVTLSAWIIMWSNAYLVSKHVKYKLIQQIKDSFPILVISILSFTLTYIIKTHLIYGIYIKGGITICIFIFFYLGFSHVLKLKVYNEIKDTIFNIIKSKNR